MKLFKLIGALVITTIFFGFLAIIFILGSWFTNNLLDWIFNNATETQFFVLTFIVLFVIITGLVYAVLTLEN